MDGLILMDSLEHLAVIDPPACPISQSQREGNVLKWVNSEAEQGQPFPAQNDPQS